MRTAIAALGLAAFFASTSPSHAQVPEWYNTHDGVVPTVSVDVALDAATGDFRYDYTVANGAGATQRLASLHMELAVTPTAMEAPPDWESSFDPTTEVVAWWASGPDDPAWVAEHDLDIPSTLSEIAAGDALPGFVVVSPCAGGTAPVPYFARGYAHLSVRPPDDPESGTAVPDWRDDSVRGTAVGPGDCGQVADWGNRRPAVDGFVGLVNFADRETLPGAPVTVQLRFVRSGETVDRFTLQVELNRIDVTADFVVNSLGDRVAVFDLATSPLETGRNVLLVSVDGLVPGTTRTATDADRFTFFVP